MKSSLDRIRFGRPTKKKVPSGVRATLTQPPPVKRIFRKRTRFRCQAQLHQHRGPRPFLLRDCGVPSRNGIAWIWLGHSSQYKERLGFSSHYSATPGVLVCSIWIQKGGDNDVLATGIYSLFPLGHSPDFLVPLSHTINLHCILLALLYSPLVLQVSCCLLGPLNSRASSQ
jgi:hypothetical protein